MVDYGCLPGAHQSCPDSPGEFSRSDKTMCASDGVAPMTLAEKLDRLFQTVRPRDGGEFTFEEVAEGIRGRGGPTVSATYIWQLRKGLRDNPTKKHLEALADFFGLRSEEHTAELQSRPHPVCRLL